MQRVEVSKEIPIKWNNGETKLLIKENLSTQIKPNLQFEDKKPKGITIHNTNPITTSYGRSMSEQYTLAQINGNLGQVAVHFYVDSNEAWKCLSETERGWHAGDGVKRVNSHRGLIGGNCDTLSIEGIGPSSYTNVVFLTSWLCYKYQFNPYKDIYKHQDWSNKYCPEYFIPKWKQFLDDVATSMKHFHFDTVEDCDFPHAKEYVIKHKISDGSRPKSNVTREELWEMIRRINPNGKDL